MKLYTLRVATLVLSILNSTHLAHFQLMLLLFHQLILFLQDDQLKHLSPSIQHLQMLTLQKIKRFFILYFKGTSIVSTI
jgi:hypothetical protein